MILQIAISIVGILLTIFLVIGVHELGHFLVARISGVKVLRVSIGFGKILYRWHDKKGTEYALAAIPLGGYVKMLDETEEAVPENERHLAYNYQPFYKKFAIVAIGPIANLIFAFVLYWLLFVVGFVTTAPVIGEVKKDSIAATAGLKPNQEIVTMNGEATSNWTSVIIRLLTEAGNKNIMTMQVRNLGEKNLFTHQLNLTHWKMDDLRPEPLESLGITPFQPIIPAVIREIELNDHNINLKIGDKIIAADDTKIQTWQDLAKIIVKNPNKKMIFKINRQEKIISLPVTIGKKSSFFQSYGYLGISPKFEWPENFLKENQYGFFESVPYAYRELKDFVSLNFIIIGKMLSGKISLASLGGPITIVESAGTALNHGLLVFANFIAFLSISIGVINLLPIPGLDGGHLLFQVIEVIIGRPIPLRWQVLFYRLGFALLFLLLLQAMVNDILRL